TVFKVSSRDQIPVNKKWETFELNSHETCLEDKVAYAKNFRVIEVESNRMNAKRLVQKSGDEYVVINPAIPWLEEKEIDFAFDLPYTRLPHFKYKFKGPIPAYEMIKFSVNMHRGCFGGCSFCTISAHQGKFISSRSERSILEEVKKVAQLPDFKGHISDLGGPSANMYKMQGRDLGQCALCKRPSCIYPTVCTNLEADHGPMLDLYKKVDEVPGIKKVTIGSGIRYDLLLPERNKNGGKSMDEYIRTIAQKHVSGRLKIAPEHTAKDVLTLMRKPPFALYDLFQEKFMKASQDAGLKQQIIPYFISSHPGCTEADMAQLAVDTKDAGFQLEQVQDFTPTPMTNATVMYYSGINPDNMKPVITAKTKDEKKAQNMFFFWYKPEFKQLIQKRLMKLKRPDLASRLLDKKR
ncbi:MAG: YgiQ family radical SAM protein, partial [Bacteroidetes bacterium]|nr:YgiQ family radical SAM protein [Bacteroidota bacterium]